MNKVEQLLKELGFDEQQIADFKDGKEGVDPAAEAKKLREAITSTALETPAALERIQKAEAAAAAKTENILKSEVRKTFDLSGVTIAGDNVTSWLENAKKEVSTRLGSNGNEAYEKQLKAIQAEKERLELEVQSAKEQLVGTQKQYKIDNALNAVFASKPTVSEDKSAAFLAMKGIISSKYKLDIDDNGGVQVLNPDGTKVLSKDQQKVLGLDDVVQESITALGIAKKSNPAEPGPKGRTPTDPPGKVSPTAQLVQQRKKEMGLAD